MIINLGALEAVNIEIRQKDNFAIINVLGVISKARSSFLLGILEAVNTKTSRDVYSLQ